MMKAKTITKVIGITLTTILSAGVSLNATNQENAETLTNVIPFEVRIEVLSQAKELLNSDPQPVPDFECFPSIFDPRSHKCGEPDPIPVPPSPPSDGEILEIADDQLGARGIMVLGSSGRRILHTDYGVKKVGSTFSIFYNDESYTVQIADITDKGYTLVLNDNHLPRIFFQKSEAVRWSDNSTDNWYLNIK